jgi:hypothetical protein
MAKKTLYALDSVPVFDFCNTCEQRFLLGLIAQEEPGALDDHPIPELYALLRAIERMWGGESAKKLTVPPELIYYLAVCSASMRWRSSSGCCCTPSLRQFTTHKKCNKTHSQNQCTDKWSVRKFLDGNTQAPRLEARPNRATTDTVGALPSMARTR